MKKDLIKPLCAGFFATLLFCGAVTAQAAPTSFASQITAALANQDYASLGNLMAQTPSSVDEVIKALLEKVQKTVSFDPSSTEKMISLAGENAAKISPPTVPAVCADLRRIVEDIPADQIGSSMYNAIMKAAESFAKAPVVVAAGRPNLCEEAWEQDALLAQTSGYRPPNIIPPPPPIPPSAD